MFRDKLADEKRVYESLSSEEVEAEEVTKSRTILDFLQVSGGDTIFFSGYLS